MINEKVRAWLDAKHLADRITEHEETIDTVEHAAQRIGCSEAEIAKTLSFIVDGEPVIVVTAGDGHVNSSRFKAQFHTKPHMIPRDQVEELTGFQPGGVCPFAVPEGIPVWLDISMKRFASVHPAAGLVRCVQRLGEPGAVVVARQGEPGAVVPGQIWRGIIRWYESSWYESRRQ